MKHQQKEKTGTLSNLLNSNVFTPLTEDEEKNVLGGVSGGSGGGSASSEWGCVDSALHTTHNAVPGTSHIAQGWALSIAGGIHICVWTGESGGYGS